MKKNNQNNGQAIIEFTFCMVMIFIMLYSIMMLFRWVGLDAAERRVAHDQMLFKTITRTNLDHDNIYENSPASQLESYFYKPIKMNAIPDVF